ncbi:MAG TPA: radical SAM protein [Roseiflexaceae bacterium]|nr:radical SAM protein [Roseiflexaceae bacterium]HMP39454.1 radical SAM protein [Roseiflexaceae bacterium]
MRLTELSEQLPDGGWRCNVCQWQCVLHAGEYGHCGVRLADEEGIEALGDGMISAALVGAVEEYRLWHFFPGTNALSVGSWGYALPADQQRGQYAQLPSDETRRRRLDPERVALVALERLCRGVVWSYSDPAVSHEYVLDVLRSVRANSRYVALVTSGYQTQAALDQLGPYLDGISLELRAFDDAGYQRLAGIEQWRGILDIAARAHNHWRCHIEVTTRLHPGVNDAAEQLQALAEWMRDTLGAETPWHVLPGDVGSAAAAAVARARRIGHDAGLRYVYGPEPTQPTLCYACSATVIDRSGAVARVVGLEGNRCRECDAALSIRTSIFKT